MAKLHFQEPAAGTLHDVSVNFTSLNPAEAVVMITVDGHEHELTGTPQQIHNLALGLLDGLDPDHHRGSMRAQRRLASE